MHSPATQEAVLTAHATLYQRHPQGFASLRIENGMLDTSTLNSAPFGCGIALDVTQFEPLNDWIKRGGMGEL